MCSHYHTLLIYLEYSTFSGALFMEMKAGELQTGGGSRARTSTHWVGLAQTAATQLNTLGACMVQAQHSKVAATIANHTQPCF
jgi:hypothetical protein